MHSVDCDWQAGFIMDPRKTQPVGYLVQFQGLNMGDFLKQDVQVFTPYNNSEATYGGVTLDKESGKATCVGVIESFSWQGGVGDPICISAWISSENQATLAAKLKTTLETTIIKNLAWWICDFDSVNKVWYEMAYPKDPANLVGQLNAHGKEVALMVDPKPRKIQTTIDVSVYRMYFEVVPAANSTYALHFASSSKTNFVRNWGLKVGENPAQAVGT